MFTLRTFALVGLLFGLTLPAWGQSPIVQSVEFTPTSVTLSGGPVAVAVRVRITNAPTQPRPHPPVVTLTGPGGRIWEWVLTRTSGTAADGVWTGTDQMSSMNGYAQPGWWNLTAVFWPDGNTSRTGIYASISGIPAQQLYVRRPPSAVADNFSALEDTPTEVQPLLNDQRSADGGSTLSITVAEATASYPMTVSLISSTRVRVVPARDFCGSASFTYTMTDGQGFATASALVNFACTPDPATFTSTPVTTTGRGAPYSYRITASDPDGAVTGLLSAPVLPSWLSLSNWTLTGTPTQADIGTHQVVLRLSEQNVPDVEQRFAITVSVVNSAPSGVTVRSPAAGQQFFVNGDRQTPVLIAWDAATDPDGDPITYRWDLTARTDFSPSLIQKFTTQTTLVVSYAELNEALLRAGVAPGAGLLVYHRIVALDGKTQTHGPATTMGLVRGTLTGVEDAAAMTEPYRFGVRRDAVTFAVREPQPVRIELFNALGQRVAALYDSEAPGSLVLTRELPERLASGVYIVRMSGRDFSTTASVVR
jgi:hypothetical protein